MLITIRDAAALANISIRAMRKLIADGHLPVIRLNQRVVRIRRSDLESTIASL